MNPWEASIPEWVTAIASLFALSGIVAVVVQLRLQKQQLIREIESDYVERYWQIRDRLDEAILGSADERRWRLAYLRLCEDQIDLHLMDSRVTKATWRQWDSGMRAELLRFSIYRELLDSPERADELSGVRALLA